MALVFWCATHASNSLGATVNTLKCMFACDVPQYSAQKPFHAYGRVRREPDVVRVVRDQVALAVELRHPEGVEHVLGREREIGRAAHRQIELVRRDHAVLRIPELPPPLVADDLNLQRARDRLCLRLEDRLDRWNGDEGEDDRWNERPAYFEGGVAVELLGLAVAVALTETDENHHQQRLDENEHDNAHVQQSAREQIHGVTELGVRPENRVRSERVAG